MSNFKVFIVVGVAVGVLGGGLVALFASGQKKPASSQGLATSSEDPVARTNASTHLPDRAAVLNNEGKNFMFAGKFAEASHRFREAVSLVPETKYFFNLGTSLFQEGKFDEALTALDGIRSANPTPQQMEKVVVLRGKILDECKAQGITCQGARPIESTPAPASATSPARAAPDRAAALNDRGKTLMLAGKFDEAESPFQEAVRLAPEPKYLFNLGTNLFQEGKFDEAIGALERLRTKNPTAEQLSKTEALLAKVYAECKEQRISCAGMK